MSDYNSDEDISWMTQTPNLENGEANFDLKYSFIEEDIVNGLDNENCVSLEDDTEPGDWKIIYDNVEVEDISSNEGIDQM